MLIRAPRESLAAAVKAAAGAAPARDVKPVLQCVKLCTSPDATPDGDGAGSLTVTGTDLEIAVRVRAAGVDVERPGECLLPAGKLREILDALKGGADPDLPVEIEADADRATVRCGAAEFELPAHDPATFPDFPEVGSGDGDGGDAAKWHEMPAAGLAGLIRRTVFAAAAEGSARFGATTGVLFEADAGGAVRLVATDGRRLALARGAAASVSGGHATGKAQHVVPSKAVKLLAGMLGGAGDGAAVRVTLRPNDVLFQVGDAGAADDPRVVLYTRLVDGRFPEYAKLLASDHDIAVPLPAGPTLAAVRAAAVMTDAESNGLTLTFRRGTLRLTAKGAESGRAVVERECAYDGEGEASVTMDSRCVKDVLGAVPDGEEVELRMTKADRPVMFAAGDGEYLALVMPLVRSA